MNAPSDKKVRWARELARQNKKELPANCETDWDACSKFIDQHRSKATDKQIWRVKKICEDKGWEVPESMFSSAKLTGAFIEQHMPKKE